MYRNSNNLGSVPNQKEKIMHSGSIVKAFLILLAILAIGYMCYFLFYPWEPTEFNMHVNFTSELNIMGFAVNNTSLDFGTVPTGAWATKNITIHYNYTSPEFVRIVASGNISKWTSVSDNNFILSGNGEKPLAIRVYVPLDVEFGEYSGTLSIYYKKLY